jgi:hypothetical protein
MSPTHHRYFTARVTSEPDGGVAHFLIEETDRRSIEASTVDVASAAFLRVIDTLGVQTVKKATLREVKESTFRRLQGEEIPSADMPGMRFWWRK